MPRQAANKTTNNNENLKDQSNLIFSQSTPLTDTVLLPSKGVLPNVPKEVVIKAVQRKDKKKALLSEADDILLAMLQYCIISPQNFNVYNLLPFEAEYLLYRLRILTYGGQHTFRDVCPYCGHVNEVTMDLSTIPIKEVPDDFQLIFDIPPLPVSGAQLTCKLLTEGERNTIAKQSKELKEKSGNKNIDLDIMWESRIVSINGNSKIAPIQITQFLDELNDYDSEYFMTYYNNYEGNYGLQTKMHYQCDECKRMVESQMPSIYTFFRPTIEVPTIK